jgi:parallel beta-helix repeat protein
MILKGAHDLVIMNKSIKGGSDVCITLIDCYNIKIINCKLTNSSEPGIYIYNCNNIVVQESFFSNVSTGIYAENSFKGGIKVTHNRFINMQGPFPRGQCIQFNNINILGESYPEDAISLYKSNGTPDSPIIVSNNYIKGGGPSKSGGGIMLGDSGGSNQTAINNILVDPGQYGIAISGGDNNAIIENYIYARAQHFTNVGIYVAGYNGEACTNSTVKSNKVNFMNNLGRANNSWIGPNTAIPSGWDTNFWEQR